MTTGGRIRLTRLDRGMEDLIMSAVTLPHAPSTTAYTPLGDWQGRTGNRQTGEKGNLSFPLARFIAGTITIGCHCQECVDRRDLALSVLYATDDSIEDALTKAGM